MNKAQKEVLQAGIRDEQHTIKLLQAVYKQASKDCADRITALSGRTDLENLQTIIWQKQYQQALKKQLDGIIDQMGSEQFTTVADYLQKCYTNGYTGVMYDLHKQGIPCTVPINQKQVVKAQKEKGTSFITSRQQETAPAADVAGGAPQDNGNNEEQEITDNAKDIAEYAKQYNGMSDGMF